MIDGIHMGTEYWWNYIDGILIPGLRIHNYENDLLHVNSVKIAPKYLGLCTQYIQGDSGGICITLGNDSMSDSKQKKFIRTWVRF